MHLFSKKWEEQFFNCLFPSFSRIYSALQLPMRSCDALLLCLQERYICVACFVYIGLADHFQRGVHVQDRHAGIHDIHAVQCTDVGDGSAPADIDPAEFCCLECHIRIIHDTAHQYSALASLLPDLPLAPVYLL